MRGLVVAHERRKCIGELGPASRPAHLEFAIISAVAVGESTLENPDRLEAALRNESTHARVVLVDELGAEFAICSVQEPIPDGPDASPDAGPRFEDSDSTS